VQGLATVTKAVALDIAGAEPSYTPPAVAANTPEPAAVTEGTMTWTPEAQQRLHRVPAGFMRDMTRTRIEALAKEKGVEVVTLETAEQAIAKARELMQETIGAYMQNTSAARQAMREPAESPGA
jgi:hypothetical protein